MADLAVSNFPLAVVTPNILDLLYISQEDGGGGFVSKKITWANILANIPNDNGIYDGSGSLSGVTTVTQGGNNLIFTGGNVGFGGAPTAKVHIIGDGTGTGKAFFIEDSSNTDIFYIQDDAGVFFNTTSSESGYNGFVNDAWRYTDRIKIGTTTDATIAGIASQSIGMVTSTAISVASGKANFLAFFEAGGTGVVRWRNTGQLQVGHNNTTTAVTSSFNAYVKSGYRAGLSIYSTGTVSQAHFYHVDTAAQGVPESAVGDTILTARNDLYFGQFNTARIKIGASFGAIEQYGETFSLIARDSLDNSSRNVVLNLDANFDSDPSGSLTATVLNANITHNVTAIGASPLSQMDFDVATVLGLSVFSDGTDAYGEHPEYTLATLPTLGNGGTGMSGIIVVTDATGGQSVCSSNGTNWIDARTGATVA